MLVFQNETKNVPTESLKISQANIAAAKEKIFAERVLQGTVSKIRIYYIHILRKTIYIISFELHHSQ